PGIGPNTAGSILAFAFNMPLPFIETNIRSVYIHSFFPTIEKAEGKRACKKIRDDQLLSFIQKTLAVAMRSGRFKSNPREWYYALMDYGSFLKQTMPNPSRQSAHHMRQSKFDGSNRQLRSRILRFIMTGPKTLIEVEKECTDKKHTIDQVRKNTRDLEKEGFIVEENGTFQVK
ncbi:MAG: A/G-specific adenine glycosylase, partial [Candidatus Pacebacteria bacterium]|nr:A/G-specific adenine glycosylase [Candidatus Paceibacterota bacterium]